MRITDNFASARAVTQLGRLRDQLATLQDQVTTGKRWSVASDDPVAANSVLRNSTQQRAITQYRTGISTARRRVNLEDGVLQQLTDLVTRAREIAIQQGDSTASSAAHQQAVGEVNGLIAQAVTLANTKDGDEFLFGGVQSQTSPFAVDPTNPNYGFTTATGAAGTRAVEIGSNDRIVANHDGATVFGSPSSGLLKSLADLGAALQSGNSASVQATLPSLETTQQNLQGLVAETGARGSRLEMADQNLSAFSSQLTASSSALQDTDLETALSTLVSKQTSYQAAMAATSRVLTMSLTQYLK
ncbi:MAG: flagellar hook-associated protein FlgL [Gemmatimonadetes bacterium]|nr:flagellar hook-associated protein FlgL [Gemmatimonadota bacterium]